MAENRNCIQGGNSSYSKDTVCIDCNRVLDSCKDKDCFADVKVFLTECGHELLEKSSSIRTKCAEIVGVNIEIDPVKFNRGFYRVLIRFYTKLICEACLSPGRSHEFEGLAVCDKSVVLYGSEGNVNIFKSGACGDGFCSPIPAGCATTNLPIAVLETVDPVVLSTKVLDCCKSCCCCCCVADIPDNVCGFIDGRLVDSDEGKNIYATLGFFSVVRIERPGQYLVNAVEYSVPEKECVTSDDDDPCALFERMAFPVNEFSPPPLRHYSSGDCKCGK